MKRRTRTRATVVLAALCLAIQGCASPGLPVTQTVQVETPGCAHVTCELRNDQGRWPLPRTPGAVTLTTSNTPLVVSCRADEGVVGGIGVPSSLQPATGVGAVAGGALGGAGIGVAFGATALAFFPVLGVIVVLTGVALGAGTGAVVDSSQRAVHYPDLITIPMSCAVGDAVPLSSPLSGAGLGL